MPRSHAGRDELEELFPGDDGDGSGDSSSCPLSSITDVEPETVVLQCGLPQASIALNCRRSSLENMHPPVAIFATGTSQRGVAITVSSGSMQVVVIIREGELTVGPVLNVGQPEEAVAAAAHDIIEEVLAAADAADDADVISECERVLVGP